MDLSGFFSAVGEQFVLFLGGGLVTAIWLAIRRFWRNEAISRHDFWPLVLTFLLAAIVAWTNGAAALKLTHPPL